MTVKLVTLVLVAAIVLVMVPLVQGHDPSNWLLVVLASAGLATYLVGRGEQRRQEQAMLDYYGLRQVRIGKDRVYVRDDDYY